MAKLKLDYDFDIIVPPSTYTDADREAVSRALAESRKLPGHKKAVAALRRTIERIEHAQAKTRALRAKKKSG